MAKKAEPKKKILILTASPRRDSLIDEMLSDKLKLLGNDVWVWPCLRRGRGTEDIFDLKPDVVVMPPIRNMASRDMVEYLKAWKVGVVTRHTEPSCDWSDFKKMDDRQKSEIWGNMPYIADLEIVWGEDELQILQKRGCKFPVHAVGSFAADIYLNNDYKKRFCHRQRFNQKHKFAKTKKNILIQSPWGFADHSPDLRIDELDEFKEDIAGRDRHLDMVEQLYSALSQTFNILVTTHPGVITEPYNERLGKLKIPLDIESTDLELMWNSDILIHAGSTMAVGAHIMNMPAFQFGDANTKKSKNWWSDHNKIMSEISPLFAKADELIVVISNLSKNDYKSNANLKTIEALKKGRYGKMDGKATERAAVLINKVQGQFKMCWPKSPRDYSQLTILKHPQVIVDNVMCGICKEMFCIVKQDWINKLLVNIGKEHADELKPKYGTCCPHCGSKFLVVSRDYYG
jgi:hypothetical protein